MNKCKHHVAKVVRA